MQTLELHDGSTTINLLGSNYTALFSGGISGLGDPPADVSAEAAAYRFQQTFGSAAQGLKRELEEFGKEAGRSSIRLQEMAGNTGGLAREP